MWHFGHLPSLCTGHTASLSSWPASFIPKIAPDISAFLILWMVVSQSKMGYEIDDRQTCNQANDRNDYAQATLHRAKSQSTRSAGEVAPSGARCKEEPRARQEPQARTSLGVAKNSPTLKEVRTVLTAPSLTRQTTVEL